MQRFFSTALLLGLLLFSTSLTNAQITTTLPNQVASGDVTQTSAILWAHSTALGTVTFEYSLNPDIGTPVGIQTSEVTDPMQPVKVAVEGLTPGTQYYYRVSDTAGSTVIGSFRTPAEVGTRVGLRFGVSGDWRGDLAPYPSVSNADERDLDFFVEFGDTVYSDYPSPALNKPNAETLEEYRIKHNEVYSERYGLNTLADLRASTFVLATIDDHEVLNDFAGGAPPASDPRFVNEDVAYINELPMFETGMKAFQEYNPIADEYYGDTGDPRTANKRKLYRFRTFGSDAALFMLDERSFRDEELPEPEGFGAQSMRDYVASAYTPGRTMLGQVQFDELKADLLNAQSAGILWKFILVPEPIQNLGPLASGDRYEGYAAERTLLLKFLVDNGISNVVFISADIHSTLINDLNYRETPEGEQFPTGAFDISTGPVAFDPPFGPIILSYLQQVGLLSEAQVTAFQSMPAASRELTTKQFINLQMRPYGYSQMGLDDSDIDATLLQGDWLVTSSFGWTEFEIDATSGQLHITVYGIPHYSQAELDADPTAITSQTPVVMTELTVNPK